jgi:hypothetical protein
MLTFRISSIIYIFKLNKTIELFCFKKDFVYPSISFAFFYYTLGFFRI